MSAGILSWAARGGGVRWGWWWFVLCLGEDGPQQVWWAATPHGAQGAGRLAKMCGWLGVRRGALGACMQLMVCRCCYTAAHCCLHGWHCLYMHVALNCAGPLELACIATLSGGPGVCCASFSMQHPALPAAHTSAPTERLQEPTAASQPLPSSATASSSFNCLSFADHACTTSPVSHPRPLLLTPRYTVLNLHTPLLPCPTG